MLTSVSSAGVATARGACHNVHVADNKPQKNRYVDPGWPELDGDDDHAVSELATDRTGALSPFGERDVSAAGRRPSIRPPGHGRQQVAVADRRWSVLSHLDESGAAHMVDVTGKDATKRTAVAAGTLRTTADVVALIASGGLPKGDALATARVAGILAAKRTSDLIPLCHPLALTGVDVDFEIGEATSRRSPRPCAPPTAPASRWRR